MIRRLRMNHRVPDFGMDGDYNLPTFSSLTRPRKSSLLDDDVVELLWQNGQVVMQSQNQRSVRKSSPSKFDASIPQDQSEAREIRPSQLEEEHNLFMQEDEMASWLNYPLVEDPSLDHNFCTELLYSTSPHSVNHGTHMNTPVFTSSQLELQPSATTTTTVTLTARPPIPPGRRTEKETKAQSSVQFSRNKATVESDPLNSKVIVRESTVVDSSDTPSVGPESRVSEMAKRRLAEASNSDVPCEIISGGGVGGTSVGGDGVGEKETMTCEMTITSSPGGSSASAEPATPKPVADDRKRKGRAPDETECQSEDIEYESADAKKQSRVRGSTSTKRSRAAEVHNLSERRRRDRINEKMKALQELIPRCNKTDKASMLDEAIEYLKTLQLQVQMMSMGCGMVPMMFPGVQQYMPPPIGMGIGMGMGMGMEMGMNRPMMQFPSLLAGSTLPMQAGAAPLGPRFPLPTFAMPSVPVTDTSRIQATNQSDQMLNSLSTQNTSQNTLAGFLDSYQQFLGSNQMQFSVTQASLQNQPLVQPNTSRPCTSRGPENLENHQSG